MLSHHPHDSWSELACWVLPHHAHGIVTTPFVDEDTRAIADGLLAVELFGPELGSEVLQCGMKKVADRIVTAPSHRGEEPVAVRNDLQQAPDVAAPQLHQHAWELSRTNITIRNDDP